MITSTTTIERRVDAVTWRRAPYDRAADEVVAYVRKAYAPVGIVIAGSIVRGEGGPTSDLDVCVVHGEDWRVREQKRFERVPVEIFVNPPAQIRRYFEEEHRDGRLCTRAARDPDLKPERGCLAARFCLAVFSGTTGSPRRIRVW